MVYFGGAFVTAVAVLLTHGIMRGVLQADDAAAVVSWTVAILVAYGVMAITATVQAVIFRRLLAWREGVGRRSPRVLSTLPP